MYFKKVLKILMSFAILTPTLTIVKSCSNKNIEYIDDNIAKDLRLYDNEGNSRIKQYVCYDPYDLTGNPYTSKYELSVGTNCRGVVHPNFNDINFSSLLDNELHAKYETINFLTNVLKVSADENKQFNPLQLNDISIKLVSNSYFPKPIINEVDTNKFIFIAANVEIQIIKKIKNETTCTLATYKVKVAGNNIEFDPFTKNLSWQSEDLFIPWSLFYASTPDIKLMALDFSNKIKINSNSTLSFLGIDYLKLAKILNIKVISFKVYDEINKCLLRDSDCLIVGNSFSIATLFDGNFINHSTFLGVR